jgi:hypothetical protein
MKQLFAKIADNTYGDVKMRLKIALFIFFTMIFAGWPCFAGEPKTLKLPSKEVQKPKESPEMIQIISAFAKGKRIQSTDVKNVSFTLKPNRAFITIEF